MRHSTYFTHTHTHTYLRTWLVHTMTGCWELSLLSLTCSTACIQVHRWPFVWRRNKRIQERSCSDCVIRRCLDCASRKCSQWTRSYHETPCNEFFVQPKWNSPLRDTSKKSRQHQLVVSEKVKTGFKQNSAQLFAIVLCWLVFSLHSMSCFKLTKLLHACVTIFFCKLHSDAFI